jgi:glycosyltransferase involved in cell wall biosynthesis
MFFRVIRKVYHGGIPFKLVLLGENRQFIPQVFLYAKDRYGDDILHYGWAESRKEYLQFLLQGDICISTAIQENFGISMVEAAALGCFPLLPRRLSYPELTPLEWQDQILYNREEELLKKLKNLLLNPPCRETKKSICRYYSEHHWIRSIEEYDLLLDRLFVQSRLFLRILGENSCQKK